MVASTLPENGLTHRRVVDLCSRSGILAAEVARGGYDVIGIDITAEMMAINRLEAPKRPYFVLGSILDYEIPPAVAVTSIDECFSYATARPGDADRLPTLFHRVRDALAPGGLLLTSRCRDAADPKATASSITWPMTGRSSWKPATTPSKNGNEDDHPLLQTW